MVWPLVVAGRLSAVSGYQDPAGSHEEGAVANRRDRPGSRDTALQISGRTLSNISVCSRPAVSMPGTGLWRYASIRVSRSWNTKQVLEFIGAPSVALDGWTIRVQRGLPSTFDAYCSNAKLVDQFDMKSTEGDYCFVSAGPVDADWPDLVVAQHFSPAQGGLDPGLDGF